MNMSKTLWSTMFKGSSKPAAVLIFLDIWHPNPSQNNEFYKYKSWEKSVVHVLNQLPHSSCFMRKSEESFPLTWTPSCTLVVSSNWKPCLVSSLLIEKMGFMPLLFLLCPFWRHIINADYTDTGCTIDLYSSMLLLLFSLWAHHRCLLDYPWTMEMWFSEDYLKWLQDLFPKKL